MPGFTDIFQHNGRIDRVLVAIFILVNLLVLVNALLHDPRVGYDSVDHLINIQALADGHLPTRDESREFFSPPLPYFIPAMLLATDDFTIEASAKAGQLINFFLSIGLTFTILLLCQLIIPSDRHLKIFALVLTGILPVYYKSFAMVSGEPYLAFLTVFALYFSLHAFSNTPRMTDALILGIILGLAILSRQWGFFLFLAIGLLALFRVLRDPNRLASHARQLVTATGVAFIVGGWFYIHLITSYGTVTAFNRQPAEGFSLTNQPRSFYLGTGSGRLFSDPVRPSYPNQFLPIFYSEMWGDYWAHFTIYGQNHVTGEWVYGQTLESALKNGSIPDLITNRQTFNAYLGRVNLVSLFPTFLLLGGFITVLITTWRRLLTSGIAQADETNFLLTLFVVISLAGYGWFLIRYPNLNKGDTIKASYALHIFPILAILAAQPLTLLTRRWPRLFLATLAVLGLVFIHDLPAMLTRFIP